MRGVNGTELFVCPQNDVFYHVSDLAFLEADEILHHLYFLKVVLCQIVLFGLTLLFFCHLSCAPVFLNNISTCAYS